MSFEHVRILLSEAASRHLDSSGEKSFTIVSKDMSDGTAGRWCIHLAPIQWDRAQQAAGVLAGTHKATRIQTRHKPS